MDSLLTRIDREIAAGRPWRAKEITRGTVGNRWPDPGVVERYGQILLRLGDELEAGKYLWLSGIRRAEYEPAVALFLRRHGRHGRKVLLAQIPKSFRRIPFDQLPPEVRGELTKYDIASGDFGRNRRSPSALPAPSRWTNALIAALAFGALVCVLVGAVVGFQIIVRWVSRALW